MKTFMAALRFLTVIPLPGAWGTAEEDLARSVPWFPVVGLLLGGFVALAAWGLGKLAVPPMVEALALVVLLLGVSGCLHLDGLSDTADGMLSARPRQEILEIMKDSHAGPMGVVAVVVVLLAKFACLASLPGALRWPAVLLMPLAGRAAIVVHLALLRNVRPRGLASVFAGRGHVAAAVGGLALLAAAAAVLFGLPGLVIWGACLAVALSAAGYVYRKIGGATGDTLGAVCEIVETVPALVLAVGSG